MIRRPEHPGQPLGPETRSGHRSLLETGPIRACRYLPRLAGRQRTTGGLYDSDEGPGAGDAGAASRSAMLQWFQVS